MNLLLERRYNLKKYLLVSLTILFILGMIQPVQAQEDVPAQPVYIIKSGDTLWNIARRFHVSYQELLEVNDLTEESPIHPGEKLSIPGLEDMTGVLTTKTVPLGESLDSLSNRYQISPERLIKLNRLTSPLELYEGVSVVLLADEEGTLPEWKGNRKSLSRGQSLLEAAVEEQANPWEVVTKNDLAGTWDLIPGQVIRVPGGEDPGPGGFPGEIEDVAYEPDRLAQGDTAVFRITAPSGTQLEGRLGDHQLHFFSTEDGYVALQGIYARAETGLTLLSLHGQLEDDTPFSHRQLVRVRDGGFGFMSLDGLPPETVSVELTQKEHDKLAEYASRMENQKSWRGTFTVPVPEIYNNQGSPYSEYGTRRSFNGSGYHYYHSGYDFAAKIGTDIYAAAPGKVVYTGQDSLIYGGVTMINHGWGVFTVYAHQSDILVAEGQNVKAGELIGKVGNTGRSTGPHLHWEVWVGGIPVNPVDWLKSRYP